jgi:hypothetical protein
MKEKYTEICQEYVEDIFKAAREYFADGIYVKSDNHPCGWDFIDFQYCLECSSDVMDQPIGISEISGGNYGYHAFEDKTLFEIIKDVGMNGWCFEISGVDNLS